MAQHTPGLNPATFLPARLSTGRLAPYIAATGSTAAAVDLYAWNIEASGAVYESLHVLEVVLRNAMHDQLAARHQAAGLPGSWMDDPQQILSSTHRQDIAKAKTRVQRRSAPTEGHVVAELSFGFWRYLLARRYQATLWPTLAAAFPHIGPRKVRALVEDPATRLHMLRNRIAHLEPIHRSNLHDVRADILTVTGYICPDTRTWLDQRCRIAKVDAARP